MCKDQMFKMTCIISYIQLYFYVYKSYVGFEMEFGPSENSLEIMICYIIYTCIIL